MPPPTSVDELMLALNGHVNGSGEPMMDATFLGTLQIKSHRKLLEACVDQSHQSSAMLKALGALGNAWVSPSRRPVVRDAVRLLADLRNAAIDYIERWYGRPSQNLVDVIEEWRTEQVRVDKARKTRMHPPDADDED